VCSVGGCYVGAERVIDNMAHADMSGDSRRVGAGTRGRHCGPSAQQRRQAAAPGARWLLAGWLAVRLTCGEVCLLSQPRPHQHLLLEVQAAVVKGLQAEQA
jgi:hypothetical protein